MNTAFFNTDAAREVAGESGYGRSVVAGQLEIACDEIDRLREEVDTLRALKTEQSAELTRLRTRCGILSGELRELRKEQDAFDVFAVTLVRLISTYCEGVSDNLDKLAGDYLAKAKKEISPLKGDGELVRFCLVDHASMMTDWVGRSVRMARRRQPDIDVEGRFTRICAQIDNATTGCRCEACRAQRATEDKERRAAK